jgi:hypothetical protein
MPNQFTGKILDKNGNPVISAQVTLYENDLLKQTTSTNKNGEYTLNTSTPVTPANCKILIYKDEKEVRSITNPQPTGNITIANLQINRVLGGVLDLQSQYAGGQYYFESLGFKGDQGDLIKDEFNLNLSEVGYLINTGLSKNIDIDITITGSESKIPNTDNEDKTEDGKRNNPNKGNAIPTLGLAKKRVEYLNKHIINDIEPFDNASIGNYYNSRKREEYISSGEEYNQGDDKLKYIKYQYVRIKAVPKKPLCAPIGIGAQFNDIFTLNYITPESKWLSLSALVIPDRFGFNNYLNPYYTIEPTTSNSDDSTSRIFGQYDLQAFGLQIFFHLFLQNSQTTTFLDIETPGQKLNYKPLKKSGNPGYDKDNQTYVLRRLFNMIDPSKEIKTKTTSGKTFSGGSYNPSVHSFFLDVIRDYPEFFKDNNGKNLPPNPKHDRLSEAITNKINDLFKSNTKIGIIEVKREITKIDMTKPEYGLRTGDASLENPNVVNGISSVIADESSNWALCICDNSNACFS